jgi:beta-galactosidase GanA
MRFFRRALALSLFCSLALAAVFADSQSADSQSADSQSADSKTAGAKTDNTGLPRIVERDGRHALMVDGAPFLALGAQVNNSSAWPASMPKVWPTMEFLRVNTVEAPVYWERLEPKPGEFNYSQVDMLLAQAREHHVRLALLWFGTWKNGSGHYAPDWIKLDNAKYPRVVNQQGRNMDSLSPHFESTLDADKAAFAAMMRHLKAADPQHTVILVQVENESGTWGAVRDFSPTAQKAFAGQVPAKLVAAMKKQPGTWAEVFGEQADEFFHAWSIATYIDQVAAAGKAEYPLPMYVNAALRDPLKPTVKVTWESGGPTDDVLDLWKASAPHLDAIGPDIYSTGYDKYTKVLDLYARPDNAMMVPETGNGQPYARYFFAALGHGAIVWSPFGMDETGYSNDPTGGTKLNEETLQPFALNYELVGPMQRVVAKLNFEGKLQAVSEDPAEHTQRLSFGDWTAVVSYGLPQFGNWMQPKGNDPASGGAMVAQLGPNEFLVTGVHARVDFEPTDKTKQRQFIQVQEGSYSEDGKWGFDRLWNGDQTDYGLNFTSGVQVLRVTVGTF